MKTFYFRLYTLSLGLYVLTRVHSLSPFSIIIPRDEMELTLAIGIVCLLITLLIWFRGSSAHSLPPGPRPVPLLGNFRDLTTKEFWLPVTKWAKQYGESNADTLDFQMTTDVAGDVIYLYIPGRSLVYLSSPEAAFELLDKRGSIYSDKPSLIMSRELCVLRIHNHLVSFFSNFDVAGVAVSAWCGYCFCWTIYQNP